jgi:hypothetical protein
MGKAIAIAVAGGAASALLIMTLPAMGLGGAVVVTFLAPLPILLVGMSLRLPGALIAAGTAAVLVAAGTGRVSGGLMLLVLYGLPAALAVRQALLHRSDGRGHVEWYPPGLVLLWIVGYGVVGLALAVALTLGQPGGLEGVLSEELAATAEAMPPDMGQALRQVGTDQLARSLPGLGLIFWALQIMANIWLAQAVLARFGRNVRPHFDIAEIDLPGWLAMALAASGVVAALAPPGMIGFIALNLALALGFCFFMAGLAVIHALVRAKPFKPLALTAVYLSLLLSWPALVIAGLGVVEQWAGFRRRALARNRED